jgi:hypothetical protein
MFSAIDYQFGTILSARRDGVIRNAEPVIDPFEAECRADRVVLISTKLARAIAGGQSDPVVLAREWGLVAA